MSAVFLKRLLDKIGVELQPIVVEVVIEPGTVVNDCYPNVLQKVKGEGGEIVYGWMIHSTAFFIEAERHAVWKSKEGILKDITPNQQGAKAIVFVVDNNWQYDGIPVDNIRLNTTNNALVDDFILISETISKVIQTGKRDENGVIMGSAYAGKAIDLLKVVQDSCISFISNGGTYDSQCYCGSNISYTDCHGFNLQHDMKAIIAKAQEA